MKAQLGGQVIWKTNSSRHDWRDGALLRRLIAHATRLGLIGPAESAESDRVIEPSRVIGRIGDALAAAMHETSDQSGQTELTVKGSQPAPWELFYDVYSFDAAEGWVDGMNTLWLGFDRSRIPDATASNALLDAFAAVHTPADTEYAVIHPYDHWSDLADAQYERPITIGLMFRGVFWATYLGPGHLDEFDLSKLRDLDAHRVQWSDSRALLLVATPDLASADVPASEPLLLRLTTRFREALRADSRWT